MRGKLEYLSATPDEAFSAGMMGDGVVIFPEEGIVHAPSDGEFTFVLKKEHLYPYDKNNNPEGLNLKEWFANYAKNDQKSRSNEKEDSLTKKHNQFPYRKIIEKKANQNRDNGIQPKLSVIKIIIQHNRSHARCRKPKQISQKDDTVQHNFPSFAFLRFL